MVSMTTSTTKRSDVRFLLDVRDQRTSYLTATLSAVYVSDGHIRNAQFSVYDPERVAHLDSLRFDAQASKDSPEFYFSTHNAVHYQEIYSVDLLRAESMTKTLRRVQKYTDKLWEEKGSPRDFAEFAQRIARSLGVRKQRIFAVKVSGNAWSYDENVYQWMNEEELRVYLANALTNWKEGAA